MSNHTRWGGESGLSALGASAKGCTFASPACSCKLLTSTCLGSLLGKLIWCGCRGKPHTSLQMVSYNYTPPHAPPFTRPTLSPPRHAALHDTELPPPHHTNTSVQHDMNIQALALSQERQALTPLGLRARPPPDPLAKQHSDVASWFFAFRQAHVPALFAQPAQLDPLGERDDRSVARTTLFAEVQRCSEHTHAHTHTRIHKGRPPAHQIHPLSFPSSAASPSPSPGMVSRT